MNFNSLNNIGLSKELFDDKEISVKQVSLKADTTIFEPNDKPNVFLIVIEGKVRIDITTKTGRDMVLYRISAGQACVMAASAMINDEYYRARAVCETDVTAVSMSLGSFYKAIETSKAFTRYILNDYSKRLLALTKLIDKNISKDILYNLCNWLLSHANQTDIIEMTHNEIAREIGTAREVVSRKLYLLEEEGAIKTSRGKIHILDYSCLEKRVVF